MTKNKKTFIIGAIVIVLLTGGYYGAKAYKKANFEKRLEAVRPQEIKLSSLQSDTVVKIEVPTAGIYLEKKDDRWESVPASNFPLDQDEIKGITWSLSNMRADRIIDEDPKDLAMYGLDTPKSHTIVTTSDGGRAEFFAGNMAPSRAGYYAMVKDDPKVYMTPLYPGERLYLTAGSIRDKKLPVFESIAEVRRFILELGKSRIEIQAKEENPALIPTHTSHIITVPYKVPRGADPERFSLLLSFFQDLRIRDFEDDNPASLAPYGLDKPARIFIQSETAVLDLLVGNTRGSAQYAKLAGAPEVFTISAIEPAALRAEAFDLVDKFALIINIDIVDSFTVKGNDMTLAGAIKRQNDEETYFFNGRQVAEKDFKNFYESCIGLVADAEHPDRPAKAAPGEISIEYTLNTPPGGKAAVQFAPYNRDFYAVLRDGTAEFLISRRQVRGIYEAAEKMEFIE
jgi:hypothetical protein